MMRVSMKWLLAISMMLALVAPSTTYAAGGTVSNPLYVTTEGQGVGAATSVAPTLAEGATASLSFDLLNGLRINLPCLSGESKCSGESWMKLLGANIQTHIGMTGVTTNTTSATFTLPSGSKTPWASVTGTGAQVANVALYCDGENTTTHGSLIGTIALSATTKDVDELPQFTKDCNWYHWVTTSISGTGATVQAWVNQGIAGSSSGAGAGDASAANQTTQITALQLLDNIVSGSGANISQINGVAPLMGAGSTGTGSSRTTEANDSQLSAGVGAAADAAATTGAAGSLTAKLRLMTTQLDTISTRVLASIADPCAGAAKILVPISQTTGTQIITGTASMRTYVCAVTVMSATAQNIALVSGTGTVCATSLGAMIGGTTAATGWNFAANGGIALGDGRGTVAKSDTDADNICILMSSTGQLSGVISYVVAAN